jgi:hypothetical protein
MDKAQNPKQDELKLMSKAQNPKQDELKLHRTFSREVETIFKDKKFLLWCELCKLAGYVDESIIDEMIAGFDVVRTGPTSPAFPSQLSTSSGQVLLRQRSLHSWSAPTTTSAPSARLQVACI